MTKEAVLAVLTRVAEGDYQFQAKLCDDPVEALKDYDLTWEEHAAVASGDILAIERWLSKLDDRTKTWLTCRLEQENWHV